MQTRSQLKEVRAQLTTKPTIYAVDMLRGQAWSPSEEERANLVAWADYYEMLDEGREVRLFVRDTYEPHPVIGSLIFNNL